MLEVLLIITLIVTGDAMLILWEVKSAEANMSAIAKAIICSRKIMKTCNNWDTQVGVQLGVKIGKQTPTNQDLAWKILSNSELVQL